MDYVDPFDYLDGDLEEEQRVAVEDPFEPDYRSNPVDSITFKPEDPEILEAGIDYGNKNVRLKFNVHEPGESYNVLISNSDLALVESHVRIKNDGKRMKSVNYLLVTPSKVLRYDGDGYRETLNELPRKAALKSGDLLEKGREVYREKKGLKTVPPPENEYMI